MESEGQSPDLGQPIGPAHGTEIVPKRNGLGISRAYRWLRARPKAAVGVIALLTIACGWWATRGGPGHHVVEAIESWKDARDLERVAGFRDSLLKYGGEAGVDPYLMAGVMWSESRGVGGQTSSAGALGLMQLSMAAASDAAKRLKLPEPDRAAVLDDDEFNLRLAANHIRWLLDHKGDWDLEAVLVSYNAGRAKLKRWIAEKGSYEAWSQSEVEAEKAGRKSTGALRYAQRSLDVAETLRGTQALDPSAPAGKPAKSE